MRPTLVLLILLLVFGCAVRKKETTPEVQTGPGVELPDGIAVGRNHQYLVKVSTTVLKPGEENTVTFVVVDAELEPVDLSKMKIEVTYLMPSMPQMGVFRAEAEDLEENGFDATLDIVHGGDWRVTVKLTPEGAAESEEVVFDYEVR